MKHRAIVLSLQGQFEPANKARASVKNQKAHTYHVDFKAKKVNSISECEYTGSVVRPMASNPEEWGFDPRKAVIGEILFIETPIKKIGNTKKTTNPKATNLGFAIDASRKFASAIEEFDLRLSEAGCFEVFNSNPHVFADALEAYKLLAREMPMLEDTMQLLRAGLTASCGIDPKAFDSTTSPKRSRNKPKINKR